MTTDPYKVIEDADYHMQGKTAVVLDKNNQQVSVDRLSPEVRAAQTMISQEILEHRDPTKLRQSPVAASAESTTPSVTENGALKLQHLALTYPEVKSAYHPFRARIGQLERFKNFLTPAETTQANGLVAGHNAKFSALDARFEGLSPEQRKAALKEIGKETDVLDKQLDKTIKAAMARAQAKADSDAATARENEAKAQVAAAVTANAKINAKREARPELTIPEASANDPAFVSKAKGAMGPALAAGAYDATKSAERLAEDAGAGAKAIVDKTKALAADPKGETKNTVDGAVTGIKKAGGRFMDDFNGGKVAGGAALLAGAFGVASIFAGPVRWVIFALLAIPALMVGTGEKVSGFFNHLFSGIKNGFSGKAGSSPSQAVTPTQSVGAQPSVAQEPVQEATVPILDPNASFGQQLHDTYQAQRRLPVSNVPVDERHSAYNPPAPPRGPVISSIRGPGFTYRP